MEIYSQKHKVRATKLSDLPQVVELIEEENWLNSHIEDLELILRVSPDKCLIAEINGELVASCFCMLLDGIAYISYLLVKKKYRKGVYGKLLSTMCLNIAKKSAKIIVIYANKRLTNVYKRYGFVFNYEVTRFKLLKSVNPQIQKIIHVKKNNLNIIKPLLKRTYKRNRIKLFIELMCFLRIKLYAAKDESDMVSALIGSRKLSDKSIHIGH